MLIHAPENFPDEIKLLAENVKKDGGQVLSIFQEPYGNNWQLFVKVPISCIKPTPYQRDLSNSHVERLRYVIETMGRYLDPIILVRVGDREYWTPNGNHRREAMVQAGREWITGILIPEKDASFYIIALNTEKAHNLKEKSLEAIRMYRSLIEEYPDRSEYDFVMQFEEAYFITLGMIYERQPKFAGGAYQSFLRKIDKFLDMPLKDAIKERDRRSRIIEDVDKLVMAKVDELEARGITHPFVKNYVVSECNPLGRKRKVVMAFDEAMEAFRQNLLRLDTSTTTFQDILEGSELD